MQKFGALCNMHNIAELVYQLQVAVCCW